MEQMKSLKINDVVYEMVDESARNRITSLEAKATDLEKTDKELNQKFNIVSNNIGNAIKKTVSGSVVTMDDVSPVEHNPSILVHGKNFLASHITKETTVSGMTCSFQENSAEVFLNGTVTNEISTVFPNTIILPKGTYTASVYGLNIPDSGADRIYLRNVKTNEVVVNHVTVKEFKTFTLSEDAEILCNIVFRKSSTYENATIKIQIELGNTVTEYTPYVNPTTVKVTTYGSDESDNLKTHIPSQDGTVSNITSLSPSMTILTDTEDVTIECEYNRDTNKVIESLIKAIEDLGGTV